MRAVAECFGQPLDAYRPNCQISCSSLLQFLLDYCLNSRLHLRLYRITDDTLLTSEADTSADRHKLDIVGVLAFLLALRNFRLNGLLQLRINHRISFLN